MNDVICLQLEVNIDEESPLTKVRLNFRKAVQLVIRNKGLGCLSTVILYGRMTLFHVERPAKDRRNESTQVIVVAVLVIMVVDVVVILMVVIR